MSKNVLLVNHTGHVSGAENSLVALASSLDPLRFHAGVASPLGDLTEALLAEGVPHYPVRLCRFGRARNPLRLARYLRAWRRGCRDLARIVRGGDFQVLHANSTSAQLFAGPVARKQRAKTVWHVRDLSPLRPVGGFCARRAAAVVAVSNAVAEHVRGQVSVNTPVRVVHNGIDAEAFAAGADAEAVRREMSWPGDAIVFSMIAQMTPWKRHEDFFMAFHGLVKSHPKARALVAGSDLFGDHPELVARLRDLVHELGLTNRLIFAGQRSDVANVIAASDAVVIPSNAEPFGRVALEAMSLGKPVVGTRAGGLPEIVLDGETGLLTPSRDPDALGAALRRLAENAELRRKLGKGGYARVRRCFTVAACARLVEEIYDSLVERKRDREP